MLEVAGEMFAEAGFHGTHFREISKRAGTNIAGICYHFQSKEGLYQAVRMEAGRQLSDRNVDFLASCAQLPPEKKLLRLTELLLQKLGDKRAWIAKLLTRELMDPTCVTHAHVASGLERDFLMIQAIMRELLVAGESADSETIPLHALRLIGECVLYCLAAENLHHPLVQLAAGLPKRAHVAEFLTERSLAVLQRKQTFTGNCT